MKRNLVFFRSLVSRGATSLTTTGLWPVRVVIIAAAIGALVFGLRSSNAATSQPVIVATAIQTDSQQSHPRVGSKVSSAVSGYEDKTVKNSLLPTRKYKLQVNLSAVTKELSQVDEASAVASMSKNQIGINRRVGVASNSMGKRTANADGTGIRVLAIKSPGAVSLRVHLQGLDLGPGDLVYVYGNAENSHVAGPYSGQGPFKNGSIWTDTINGDTAIIEYYFKGREHPFQVTELSHVFASRKQAAITTAVKDCELDERCYNDNEKDAVGRIDFIAADGSGEFVCSGTLLNDHPQDEAPFFLTANHCVGVQSEAESVEVWWFYQTTSCDSGVLRSDVTLSEPTGANLLATDVTTDSTLLSITGQIPSGVVYAGYDPNPMPVGTEVFGMHHPGGFVPPDLDSYLRHTHGTIISTSDSCDSGGPFNAYEVQYDQGLTEGGSSGSGIWVTESGTNFLIGELSCGTNPSCTKVNMDDFHKFSDIYPLIQNFLTQGLGSSGGGGIPVINTLSASLTANTLSLTGSATDSSATLTQADVTFLDQFGNQVGTTGDFAFNFGSGPTSSFTITINNMNQYLAAVSAKLVVIDNNGATSASKTASFSQGDSSGPAINKLVFYPGQNLLVVKGGTFFGNVQLEVNGVIVAPPAQMVVKPSGGKVKIFGSEGALNLNSGPNRVRIIQNGSRSNLIILSL